MRRYFSFKSLAVFAAAVFAAIYFITAIPRVLYPYDLDFVEDGLLMHSLRFAQGQPVYAAPSADFAADNYTPLYLWLGGLLFKFTGPGLLPLRLSSLAATLTTAALIFCIARRESGLVWLGLACAGLYLGGHRISGFWYELARVDSLFVTLTLGGVALGIYSRPAGSLEARRVLAAVVLSLAFFTKQTGAAFAVWLFIHLLITQGRRAWLFGIAYSALTIIPFILLNIASDGWFAFYTLGIASGNPVEWERAARYVVFELFGVMGGLSVLLALAGILAWRRAGWGAIRVQPWLAAMAVAIFVSGVGRSSVGGNLNNLMIGYGFLCLAPAILMRELREHPLTPRRTSGVPHWHIRLISAAIIIQFALGVYNPLRYIPTPEMQQSGDRLVARIAAIDGEVLVMMHPYYALLAGKTPSAQIAMLWRAHARGGLPLPEDFTERIRDGYYSAIISDETLFETDPAIRELLAAYYAPTAILETSESPPAITGMFARPQVIYIPKEP
jgi:hypothetical protein